MPIKKTQITITLNESTHRLLSELAELHQTSMSSLAKKLIHEALEIREDRALSALAQIRGSKKTKKISHIDAWK